MYVVLNIEGSRNFLARGTNFKFSSIVLLVSGRLEIPLVASVEILLHLRGCTYVRAVCYRVAAPASVQLSVELTSARIARHSAGLRIHAVPPPRFF